METPKLSVQIRNLQMKVTYTVEEQTRNYIYQIKSNVVPELTLYHPESNEDTFQIEIENKPKSLHILTIRKIINNSKYEVDDNGNKLKIDIKQGTSETITNNRFMLNEISVDGCDVIHVNYTPVYKAWTTEKPYNQITNDINDYLFDNLTGEIEKLAVEKNISIPEGNISEAIYKPANYLYDRASNSIGILKNSDITRAYRAASSLHEKRKENKFKIWPSIINLLVEMTLLNDDTENEEYNDLNNSFSKKFKKRNIKDRILTGLENITKQN